MKNATPCSIRLSIVVTGAAVLLFAGCVKPYQAPKPGEPAAIVRLQYTYNSIKSGTNLRVQTNIRENPKEGEFHRAYQGEFGLVEQGKNLPEIPMQEIRVRPNTDSVFEMRLAFWWTTQRWVATTTYDGYAPVNGQQMVSDSHEVGCSEKIVLSPEADKIYLMNFSNPNVNKGCTLNAFEQIPEGQGKFRLKKTGRPHGKPDEMNREPPPPEKK